MDERHLHQDLASGAKDDRSGLKACLTDLSTPTFDLLELNRLSRSLSRLLTIILDLKSAVWRSTRSPSKWIPPRHTADSCSNVFGSLAQLERALITERVNAGLSAAKRRGRIDGSSRLLHKEQIKQIVAASDGGASKASVCRAFKMPRSTPINNLDRIGWQGAGVEQWATEAKPRTALKLAKAKVA